MMRSLVATLISLAFALPAFGKTHNNTYSVPCSQLWDAVQDTIRNSGNYTLVLADSNQMTASYNIKGTIHGRTNSVHLEAQGSSCEMQVQSSFSGVFQADADDFKNRVDQSLAKLKASKTSEPAKP